MLVGENVWIVDGVFFGLEMCFELSLIDCWKFLPAIVGNNEGPMREGTGANEGTHWCKMLSF